MKRPQLPASFTDEKIDAIVYDLGLKNTAVCRDFIRTAFENAVLFDGKMSDYGPDNIGAFGTYGVVVRLHDKIQRLKTLFNKGKRRKAVNESIEDSLRDTCNYGIIATMVERKQWPT